MFSTAKAPRTSDSRSSTPVMSLPVISIAPYIEPNADPGERRAVSEALHAACRDFGFFYLDISSLASEEETKEITSLARKFFGSPQAEKDKLSILNEDVARGYQRLFENVTNGLSDNHEAIDFYAPVADPDKSKPLWGSNQWPSDELVPGFRSAFETWTEKMKKLGLVMMEAMAAGLGFTPEEWRELKGNVIDSFWVMRIIGYPPLPNDFEGYSCGAHKDYGCLTFLYADETKDALQVFIPKTRSQLNGDLDFTAFSAAPDFDLPDEQGDVLGTWIKADPKPGCVVCNIGEMWEVWTNGMYKSTLHRVIHRGSNYRVSIPFFFEPNFDALVKPAAAALRLQAKSLAAMEADPAGRANLAADLGIPTLEVTDGPSEEATAIPLKDPVVYGQFLVKKVRANFNVGNDRFQSDEVAVGA